MAKAKYKIYVEKMIKENKELFDEFQKLHDEYALNQDEMQEKYNEEGEKVLRVVREYENRLCRNSERGGYGVFTSRLAEKFQEELKKHYPLIDHIGIIVKRFNIRKISLN